MHDQHTHCTDNVTLKCECVFVALVVQHAMRMRRVILSSVTCPAVQYFSTVPQDFRKEDFEHKMCVLIFSTVCFWIIPNSKKK